MGVGEGDEDGNQGKGRTTKMGWGEGEVVGGRREAEKRVVWGGEMVWDSVGHRQRHL